MKTQRIDHVTVLTPDAARARATFRESFGFRDATVGALGAAAAGSGAAPESATALTVGQATIEFVRPAAATPLADALTATGEGMAALCLEVASLDDALESLEKAGVRCVTERVSGRRVVRIDPAAAHGVRLTLVEPA